MKRRLFALALALLLAVSLPVSALALDWYIDDGDITINATADGKQTVKQGNKDAADDDPTITQRDSSKETSNTITIDADEHTTANVTLDGVNINTDADANRRSETAFRTEGEGDVNIELDGSNTLWSGYSSNAAGLNKGNSGTLTINDEDNNGTLEATGGYGGAGIGGGSDSGPNSASGILISGGKVTATGGDFGGAGIEGGNWSSASDITITGGEVAAKGGTNGAGIGGGWNGSGGNLSVSISGDAQVKVQGGNSGHAAGAGAGIGNGGFGGRLPRANGDEVEPDTSGLTENGRLEYYAPGADMENDAPEKVIENKPEASAPSGAPAPVYHVTDKDGNQSLIPRPGRAAC